MNSSANHLGERDAPSPTNDATKSRSSGGTSPFEFDDEASSRVAESIAGALALGDAVLLVSTPECRDAIGRALQKLAVDVEGAYQARQLLFRDANELSGNVRPAEPGDAQRFHAALGELVRETKTRWREHRLHAYVDFGELPRDPAQQAAAARLEELWSALARAERLCLIHAHTSDSFDPATAPSELERLRARVQSLEEELERHRQGERALRERQATLEKEAQVEREKLRQLFVQAPALVVILRGPNHVYDFVNAAAQRLLNSDDIVGRPLREVMPDLPPERLEVIDRVFRTGERYVADNLGSTRDWNRNGRPYERFFNVVYEPYRNASGRIEGVMSFGFEVTEQVLANRKIEAVIQELESANRTKDEFLATVSHELRTPLNAILGWVRMLRSGTLSTEKQARALETIDRNASAQAQLIEDLLDVSRIISGKLRLDVSAVEIATIVDEAIESVRPAATAKGLLLSQTVVPHVGPILGDPDRLRQVVWNLLTNAVKFTPKGGSVHVNVERNESSITVAVSDTGQGIPPEFVSHVFEQFRQADSTTTRKHGGLGLGLAIVRSLVELHGGSVRAESEGLGKGATFTVSLPISAVRSSGFERPPALRLVASSAFRAHGELTGVHVLVLDDEDDARNLLAEILSGCGARVSTASSVAQAMGLIESTRPDVIVSDIGMPGEDGYDFIRQLRALPASSGGRTPAVALTAYCRVEDRTKALAAGFNMHAPKPIEPAELIAGLASLAALFERN
ncbi:MAG: ATP-binding protein [Myxococcota bacterium]